MIVWGEEYWDLFLNKMLFSRFTQGNFPALCKQFDVSFKLFTQQKDKDKYRDHPTLKSAFSNLPLSIISFDELSASKYTLFALVQKKAIEEANLEEAALIFDFPDHIYTNTFFSGLIPYILNGYRLLLTPGINLSKEDFLKDPVIVEKVMNNADFKNQDLISAALKHLHPTLTKALFKDSQNITDWPSQVLWKKSEEGFIQTRFHLHPFYIWPEKNAKLLCQTIDYGEYLIQACPDTKKHKVCSAEPFTYFELSSKHVKRELWPGRNSLGSYVYWAKQFVHPYQIQHLRESKKVYSAQENSRPSFKLSIKINLFLVTLLLMSKLPLFLLKPYFYRYHKDFFRKDATWMQFLRRGRIKNYWESLLLTASSFYPLEDILEFISINSHKLKIDVLRKALAQAFLVSSPSSYPYCFEQVLKTQPNPILIGQFIHESSRLKNRELVHYLIQSKKIQKIPEKYLGYILRELALQHYFDLFEEMLENYSFSSKIQKRFFPKCLLILAKLGRKQEILLVLQKSSLFKMTPKQIDSLMNHLLESGEKKFIQFLLEESRYTFFFTPKFSFFPHKRFEKFKHKWA